MRRILSTIFGLVSILNATTHHAPGDYLTIQTAVRNAEIGDTVVVKEGVYSENMQWSTDRDIQILVFANLHVSATGDDSNTGLSYLVPLRTIQYATSIIEADSQNPHSIYVRNGLYSPSTNGESFPLELPDYVSIIGESKENVIIDAENQNTVFLMEDNEQNSINNISITGGIALLTDTVFPNTGGGIHCTRSNLILENVLLYENSAYNGGALYFYQSSAWIKNITIVNNSADNYGGAIRSLGSNFTIESVLMTDNTAYRGAAINFFNTDCILSSTTITENVADITGGGIFLIHKSKMNLINSIVWGNIPDEIKTSNDGFSDTLAIDYSNILPGDIIISEGDLFTWGTGNILANPQFRDPINEDFELSVGSPCVDAGIALFVLADDTLVNLAQDDYSGLAPDMGGFETMYYGDLNQDGSLSLQDLIRQIEIILFAAEPANPQELIIANLNSDDIINVQDVVLLLELILNI